MASLRPVERFASKSPAVLSLVKVLLLGISSLPSLRAAPTRFTPFLFAEDDSDASKSPGDATLWIYLTVAVGLVLLGGAFAGLTIALMGQDEIYLEVIKTSGDGAEKKHAATVLKLLKRGKHWVLVTLLLGNVITNETLPIVLDRSLGGGWPAVLGSTGLIVIFGEIIPQSICVRYGLPIGAWMSPLVLVLMYILSPVAWPTAKLLDRLLGEDHGTTYKKAGLKTLVTLHKTLGSTGEQLNADEVTIISAVLDLKEKPVGSIMTPMANVFTMSADTVLNEKTMDVILSAGYSRIPIHAPDNPSNFIGMLLVKILITYDPEDSKMVHEFALATLPETSADTSCLDIVNFFQEGKSHMVLVSEFPGEDRGALGVVTLEDVIEELIGEEIIDESDVFVDVHKAIRRMAPAPRFRVPQIVSGLRENADGARESLIDLNDDSQSAPGPMRRTATVDALPSKTEKPPRSRLISSPKSHSSLRRTSSTIGASEQNGVLKRASDIPELREHFKHLGPSNLASRPRQTRFNTVKIKPGGGARLGRAASHDLTSTSTVIAFSPAPSGGVGEGLLQSVGTDATDGVHALQQGYGSMSHSPRMPQSPKTVVIGGEEDRNASNINLNLTKGSQTDQPESVLPQSTVASLPSWEVLRPRSSEQKRLIVKSGSITENIIEANGIKKVVLETTSSSDDNDKGTTGVEASSTIADGTENEIPESLNEGQARSGKKRRRRKRKKDASNGENTPLLETNEE